MSELPFVPLPPELYSPGFVAGEGVNDGVPRNALPLLHFHKAYNVWASERGVGNVTENDEGLGTLGLNSTTPVNARVQEIIPFGEEVLFIVSGNVYKMGVEGGAITLVQASVFDANANVYYQYGRGGTPKTNKVYILDDSRLNNPYHWDGSSLVEMTQFNSSILGYTLPKPVLLSSEHTPYDERMIYGFGADIEFGSALLFSAQDNGEDVTTAVGSITDAHLDFVSGMSNSYIVGFNVMTASEQSTEIADTLFVAKSDGRMYRTGNPKIVSGVVVNEFNLTGVNLGAVNGKSLVAFSNDLISMDKNGIGSYSFATNSGQIEALSTQLGARVNPVIRHANNKKPAEVMRSAFTLHCPERQVILFFLPSGGSSASLNGWTYPEAPADLCIQYQYGVTAADGGVRSFWSYRKGVGWAWSCGCVIGKRIFLGSYFGDIYELFRTDTLEPNPDDPDTDLPVKVAMETGDMDFGDLTKSKSFNQLWFHWNLIGNIDFDLTTYYNGSESGHVYEGLGELVPVGRWNEAEWNVDRWAGISKIDLRGTPGGRGKTARLKIEWDSQVNGVSNRACLTGVSGILGIGDDALKYRR